MNRKPGDPTDHAPLKAVEFHVLLALLGGDLHGYRIVKDIERRTEGAIKLVPGNLYPVLRRLVDTGWLAEGVERPPGAVDHKQRRYYRITPVGRRIAAAEAVRLQSLVQKSEVRKLIDGFSEG